MRIAFRPATGLASVLCTWLILASCSNKAVFPEFPNQPPRVTITSAPASGGQIGNYAYELSWAGYDSDGYIDHFKFVVDPPSQSGAETTWVTTTLNRRTFVFRADSLISGNGLYAERYHVVAVVSVDNRGGISAPAAIAFTARTVAPSVRFTTPTPSALLSANVGPTTRVSWLGTDPDGIATKLPESYRLKIFGSSSEPSVLAIALNPDTLLRLYAPSFADWDTLPGSATGVTLRDLLPGAVYALAIVAIDEAGAYSTPMTFDGNILRFAVRSATATGPRLHLFSGYFDYTYPTGGFYVSTADYIRSQVPAGRPTVIEWEATPLPGAFVAGYRWARDIERIDDETARVDEATDLSHWSQWGIANHVTLPSVNPLSDGAVHRFYLEAKDNAGAMSLAVVELASITPTLERDLLIIDDTRLLRDTRLPSGCVQAPRGFWPTAAELDTFLFATGGVPWRCYPEGTLSSPGIFKGYTYDSLATFGLSPDAITLSRLFHYRHVVWMVNGEFSISRDAGDLYPIMRWLSAAYVFNPLLSWLRMGGSLWVMGGGVATASQMDWEVKFSPSNVYASSNGELGPGRFMYNAVHWRSEITTNRVNRAVRSSRAVGGWAGAPDYGLLPEVLLEKSIDTDPMVPNRTNSSDFYRSNYIGEYLTKPNELLEPDPADPTLHRTVAVLDTVYETSGGTGGSGWPVMTVYHGGESNLVLFSGFPVWYFQRPQTLQVTDWVLQHVWGLPRRDLAR